MTRTSTWLLPLVLWVSFHPAARAQLPDDCGAEELWSLDAALGDNHGLRMDFGLTLGAAASRAGVTVYRRDAAGWVADALLTGESVPQTTYAGCSADGHLVAYGRRTTHPDFSQDDWVEVMRRDGVGWELEAVLRPDVENPGNHEDVFGLRVVLDGTLLAVGAPESFVEAPAGSNASGAVYLFEQGDDGWSQVERLIPSEVSWTRRFGESLDLDGDRAIVGARFSTDTLCPPTLDCGTAGLAFIYERQPSGWVEVAALHAPDAVHQAEFGFDVAIFGDRAAVGAPRARSDRLDRNTAFGAVYIYERSVDGTWELATKLMMETPRDRAQLGLGVGLGEGVVVATQGTSSPPIGLPTRVRGTAELFEWEAGSWSHAGALDEGANGDAYGWSLDLAGDSVLSGAPTRSDRSGVVWAHACTSIDSVELDRVMGEPSAVDLRVAPPLDLSKQGNFLVLGWEETMGDPYYDLQAGSLSSLWQDATYDHEPVDCGLLVPSQSLPMPVNDSYYLIQARDKSVSSDLSPLGRDSFGRPRPFALLPCP